MERLHLLHGPAVTSSRKKLTELKKQFDSNNTVVFEQGTSLEIIKNNLSATSLFSDNRLVILENPPEDFNYELSTICELVLWFDHEVSEKKPLMAWVRSNKGQITFFKEEKEVSVFPFLDCLGNKDKHAYLKLDQLRGENLESQYIITMIFYLLRSLTVIRKNAPQFVRQKLLKQKKNFSDKDLINLYRFVLETDFKIKSGLMEPAQAEFLLVGRFVDN